MAAFRRADEGTRTHDVLHGNQSSIAGGPCRCREFGSAYDGGLIAAAGSDAHDGDGGSEVGEVLVLRPDFGLVDEGCGGDPGVVDTGFAARREAARGEFGVGGGGSLVA